MWRTLPLCLALILSTSLAATPQPQWITLASGERDGMYYWFANLLGGIVSQPPGALPCNKGCGIDGSILVNLASEGSLDNLQRLRNGSADTAFVQSGLAYAAYSGHPPFENQGNDTLRAIASFYPEMLHIVVSKDSGIQHPGHLGGKRLAMGSMQSGTLASAKTLLARHGLEESDYHSANLTLDDAMQAFLEDKVDALFFFSAAGNPLIKNIAAQKAVRLLPVESDTLKQLVRDNSYYQPYTLPAHTYHQQEEAVSAIAVQALWITTSAMDDAQIYALTKAAWEGQPHITWLKDALPLDAWNLDHALKGIGIPLHPGAKKYYNEIGKRF
ncbi:MAG: TAXI family TRAP transporter solute-binding subunit [Cardiobacteriaceae bacterium]|nr:TAXI family TRAP transporter solute-binding subunit [Cardiobacteriaceae bacterium]